MCLPGGGTISCLCFFIISSSRDWSPNELFKIHDGTENGQLLKFFADTDSVLALFSARRLTSVVSARQSPVLGDTSPCAVDPSEVWFTAVKSASELVFVFTVNTTSQHIARFLYCLRIKFDPPIRLMYRPMKAKHWASSYFVHMASSLSRQSTVRADNHTRMKTQTTLFADIRPVA